MALVLLVHFVGDIHQPLHCISRFDSMYPDGDKGANLIVFHDGTYNNKSLHWLVDSDKYVCNIGKILNYQKYYTDIDTSGTPRTWAIESYNLAVDMYYKLDTDETRLNESSITRDFFSDINKEIINKRIVQSALRLAELLNKILI